MMHVQRSDEFAHSVPESDVVQGQLPQSRKCDFIVIFIRLQLENLERKDIPRLHPAPRRLQLFPAPQFSVEV
jgi:hypothetical protein